MDCFKELIGKFDLSKANENEKLMYYAICALITIVERQQREIDEKEDKEPFYG